MEDYVDCVSNLINPGVVLPLFHAQSVERLPLLGYVESTLRRRPVWESWSPYEVAVFEGFVALWGKRFHLLSKRLPHKTIKDVVAFYYVWKKTKHYKEWKRTYYPDDGEIRFQSAKKAKKK